MIDIASDLHAFGRSGDIYLSVGELYRYCFWKEHISRVTFQKALSESIRKDVLYVDNDRIYRKSDWQDEEDAAHGLADRLRRPKRQVESLPDPLIVDGITLCDEQRQAVLSALSQPISLVVAGAGCGKTTIIQAIARYAGTKEILFCAPTGKAAINLRNRCHQAASTIDKALVNICAPGGMRLSRPISDYDLIIVDEASMVSLQLLAKLLTQARADCRFVFLGDTNQLPSVGTGNVLQDMISLKIPCARLQENHRQTEPNGLLHNVNHFESIHYTNQLAWDDSFCLRPDLHVAPYAAQRLRAGVELQVLAYTNKEVDALNGRIQQLVNPAGSGKRSFGDDSGRMFTEGDRVMILKNDYTRYCFNGDVGILHFSDSKFFLALPDGRNPSWNISELKKANLFSLAYACTIHKSQGSEYDEVILVLSKLPMFDRSLFYTAISRAKKRCILCGSRSLVKNALATRPHKRTSTLVQKTLQNLQVV
jgi:exodeoxyribonuclease V alpha subunit